jgi:hypothetical protein
MRASVKPVPLSEIPGSCPPREGGGPALISGELLLCSAIPVPLLAR